MNVLGDAINDARRPDWNWFVTDVWGWSPERGRRSDLRARAEIERGLPVIFYLLDDTREAHAVLANAFEVLGGEVLYRIYDPNYPYDDGI